MKIKRYFIYKKINNQKSMCEIIVRASEEKPRNQRVVYL